jgi:hypothetical protein
MPGQSKYLIGCETGCRPCLQDPDVMQKSVGAVNTGRRWLRPSDVAESRDARGRFIFPLSAEVLRLPPLTTFQLAMCWRFNPGAGGFGSEFWALTICDCKAICPATGFCFVWVWDAQTCHWFIGYNWPPDTMACTGKYLGDAPEALTFRAGSLAQAALVSTGRSFHKLGYDSGCSSNVGVLCWGAAEDTGTDAPCTINDPYPAGQHFNDNWSVWERVYIHTLNVALLEHSTSPDPYHLAEVTAKNAALTWLRNHLDNLPTDGEITGLDQIDGADSNTHLDWWGRGWNDATAPIPVTLANMPAIETWPNCYLEFSGHAVTVEWVLAFAAIEASIVLRRLKTRELCPPGLGTSEELKNAWPLIKLRVRMNLACRAEFSGEGPYTLSRDWLDDGDLTLEIENREEEGIPRILPLQNGRSPDRIVYVDNSGRQFDQRPPLYVEWLGDLGPASTPAWADIFDHDYWQGLASQVLRYECCAAAKGFGNVVVPAELSDPDEELEDDQKRLYTGEVRIGVNYQLAGMCPP